MKLSNRLTVQKRVRQLCASVKEGGICVFLTGLVFKLWPACINSALIAQCCKHAGFTCYINRVQTFYTTDFTAFKQAVIRIRLNKSSDQKAAPICMLTVSGQAGQGVLWDMEILRGARQMGPPQPPKLCPRFYALSPPTTTVEQKLCPDSLLYC